ncbi:MAG: hypothetical protein ABIH34_00735 [Nanoarchaeota archaeon]
MDAIIKISSKEKDTSIRIKEKTKKMLESLSIGKETHDDIVRRLIKLTNQMSAEQGTKIIEKGRITGTEYERLNKQFEISHHETNYSVVGIFNDLTIINMLRKNKLLRKNMDKKIPDWEINLEIVNVKKDNGKWTAPSYDGPPLYDLLYYACLKSILEEFFEINLFELMTERDLLNIEKWEQAYNRNDLSKESFDIDINKRNNTLKRIR